MTREGSVDLRGKLAKSVNDQTTFNDLSLNNSTITTSRDTSVQG
jgi:hypothetical protein